MLVLLLVVLPIDELGEALLRIPPRVAAALVIVYLSLHLLGVLKWRLLVNAAGGGLDGTDAVRCYYAGLFGNFFLPSLVGGDAVRAGLAFRAARSGSGVLFGSLVDRLLDVAGLAGLAAAGAWIAPSALAAEPRRLFRWLSAFAAAAALGAIALFAALPARRLPFRVRRWAVRVRRSIRALLEHPVRIAGAFAIGLVLQGSLILLNAWLGRVCGIEIAASAWLFAWPLAKLSALVPLTQGGLGVREAALATLLVPFGVPAVLSVAAGLAFQAVILSGSLLSGLVALVAARRRGERAFRP